MRRRDFISLISCTAAAWPILAKAEQPERIRHIGAIFGAGIDEDDLDVRTRFGAFQEGLKELGWVDGRNIRIELRASAGDAERIRKHAQELVTLAPDVIVVAGAAAAAPMLKATHTIPVVFFRHCRSGRCWFRRQFGATGWQCYRLYQP